MTTSPSPITRFSSRRQRLDREFLAKRLQGAKTYDRIAGYFRSSIFELVGEEIESIETVRIVCNSDLDVADIHVSQAARDSALKGKFNEVNPATESILHGQKYRRLYDLLQKGNVEIRVVPKDKVFLHGKAGVIEQANGAKTSFMGSINESKSAFAFNYELLWEDESPEAVQWVQEEFDALWEQAYPLPDAIIEEIERIAKRVEIRFEKLPIKDLPAASLVESPLYRAGQMLQSWQRAFVSIFMDHRNLYGKARLLLADEVGVGKTLSMAVSGMMSALLNDGPVLILCPSTLTHQWQIELKDKLGIPSTVWQSKTKCWVDEQGHVIKNPRRREDREEEITRCPSKIGIVSQGLVVQKTRASAELLTLRYGTIILDEGHKARIARGISRKEHNPNNLYNFMYEVANRTQHLIIGTATPMQTDVEELWDLLKILNQGADFVLGKTYASRWHNCESSLPLITGNSRFSEPELVWDWLRSPLPPASEASPEVAELRQALDLDDKEFHVNTPYTDLDSINWEITDILSDIANSPRFFENNNPILRHTVLRRRDVLEDMGILEKVAVDVHPDPKAPPGSYQGLKLQDQGLITNLPFNIAYEAAEEFTKLLQQRVKGAGFLKNLLLQRICSSFEAGRKTAEMMLEKRTITDSVLEEVDDEDYTGTEKPMDTLTDVEASCLQTIVTELSRPEARDPKLEAVEYFLDNHRTGSGLAKQTWLEHGCIVFTQYYDTALWVASAIAKAHPDIPVAVYAGVGKSRIFSGEDSSAIEREPIKEGVRTREIKIVVATDAACEGLNLQALGTLINVDLPWNPSKLEQRLGRIKRFGQSRSTVDMANLVYSETRDEKVYSALSKRLKDKFDLFGSLPDTIDDEWIEDVEQMEEELDKFVHLREESKNAFQLRYQTEEALKDSDRRWELCQEVLSRQELLERLSEGWSR